MKLIDTYQRVVEATIRATNEHGVPNSFGLGELNSLYSGRKPFNAGNAGQALRKWTKGFHFKTLHNGPRYARYNPETRRLEVS